MKNKQIFDGSPTFFPVHWTLIHNMSNVTHVHEKETRAVRWDRTEDVFFRILEKPDNILDRFHFVLFLLPESEIYCMGYKSSCYNFWHYGGVKI